MPSLYDLVIDLINDAKNTKDNQTKLYVLEQIKEICFHRDKAILKDVMGNIIDFMIEKSMPVRKFLIKFMEEAILQDMDNSFSYYLNLINYLIQESNDSLLIILAKSFQNYYDSILLKIANMSPTSKSQGILLDSKQLWSIFNSIVLKFHDFISSSRNDQLKVYCLKIFEIEMIFGLPNPVTMTSSDPRLAARKVVNDPRLARGGGSSKGMVDSSSSAGTSNKSVDEISLHHPFISKTEIQRAAEENFTKALLWSSKGGPQGYPFTPNLMALLGQLIANVSSIRLKNAPTGAKALIYMIQGKGSIIATMTGSDRENLARAVHRLLRATNAASAADPEGIVPKLKASVAALENLGIDSAVLGQKRALDSSGGVSQNDEEDNENILTERKNAAITAVNAAEIKLKSMQTHTDTTSGSTILTEKSDGNIGKTPGGSTGRPGIGKVIFMGDSLELSKELPSLDTPSLANTLKLVRTIQTNATTSITLTTIATNRSSDTNMTIIQKPIAQPVDNYSELALCTLKKLFENYQNLLEQSNEKMLRSFHLLCVKSLLSMILTDLFSANTTNSATTVAILGSSSISIPHAIEVQIVSVLPTNSYNNKLVDEIPMNVKLPKTIWYFLGFILTCNQSTLDPISGISVNATTISEQEQLKDITNKLEILIKFCNILYDEICWQKEFHHIQTNNKDNDNNKITLEDTEEEEESEDKLMVVNGLVAIYEATCLVTMTRMIQSIHLRCLLREFMKKLPMIPKICITTLLLLIHIGSKGSTTLASTTTQRGGSSTQSIDSTTITSKNRGTRLEALLTMGQLVFYSDKNTATDALTHLLWCCIAEDFELRSKVINVLTNDILHVETWCDDFVITFALQAMVNVIGTDAMTSWFEQQKKFILVSSDSTEMVVSTNEELLYEDSAMLIDTEEIKTEVVAEGNPHYEDTSSSLTTYPTLYTAYSHYDGGISYQGTFPTVPSSIEQREVHTKRVIQLLTQICLSDLRALSSFMDIYIASTYISSTTTVIFDTTTSELSTTTTNITGSDDITNNSATIETKDSEVTVDSSVVTNKPTNTATNTTAIAAWTMFDTLKLELRNILPVLCQHNKLENIFDSIITNTTTKNNNIDHLLLGRPLLLYVLNHIYPDYNIPATTSMISKVKKYIQHIEQLLYHSDGSSNSITNRLTNTSNELQDISLDTSVIQEKENVVVAIDNTTNNNNNNVDNNVDDNVVLTNIKDDVNFKLMLPLISGISTKEIEMNLPRIILVYMDEMDELKTIFSRITKAHPPPMSKAMLIVNLHRIDYELHGLKAKAVLDAISLCLNDKTEFTSDVIKEALKTMLIDKIPPYALMRTALLSSQSYSEVKKYVLGEVIPALVGKYIWISAPKLWDGVVYGAKNLATTGFKNSELTLRALLGLPYQPLKALLRVAPNVKLAMAKLLKTFSIEEKENVCSGKWVGVNLNDILTYTTTTTSITTITTNSITTSVSSNSITVGEEKDTTVLSKDLEQNIEKYEIEKQKIIKDIMNTPIPT